jgi:hypothetical protein
VNAPDARVHTVEPGDARRRLPMRPDWFEVLVLVALTGLASFVAATAAWRARGSLVWTGTDGPFIGDQMQYLGWIRDSAHGVLIGNPFVLDGSHRAFAHPGLMISGVLNRLGLPAAAAYLVWKPIAIVALFVAIRAYVHRMLDGTAQRRVALVLAALAFTPVPAVLDWSNLLEHPIFGRNIVYFHAIAFDMWPTLYLWGYPFTALAVAAMVGCFLVYERDRASGKATPWPPLLGLLCAWLQPWQGSTVLAVIVGAEAMLWFGTRRRPPRRLVVSTSAATALPLLYYAILSKVDASWELAGEANRFDPWPWWTPFAAIAPLLILAALSYGRRPRGFQDIVARVWLPAVFILYWLISYSSFGTFPLHTVQGLSIPLAVLAVSGAATLPMPRLRTARVAVAIIATAAFTIPATGRQLDRTRDGVLASREPYLITADERTALAYVENAPGAGGVLAPVYLGQTVPGLTGRKTWVGIASWTPDYKARVARANALFDGRLARRDAREFVRSTGARFLVSDCRDRADLASDLGPILTAVRRFGCATVYRVGVSRLG